MHVFLDIDGVFRSNDSPPYDFEAHCVSAFEAVLEDFPEVHLVISSAWRLVMSMSEIAARFPSGLRLRIVGRTPMLDCRTTYIRYQEILNYLNVHCRRKRLSRTMAARVMRAWVAIDDDPRLYPEAALGEHLLLTDGSVGFDDRCANELRMTLDKFLKDVRTWH